MIYDVQITEEAERDLRCIFEYICNELCEPGTAGNLLNRMEERILSLEQLPYRYRRHDKEPWKSRGLRMMPVENYIVFYIPDDDTHTVYIVRVLYGGRNIPIVLGGTDSR